jgi:hypothetical protein
MAEATPQPSFSLFPSLPGELRNAIWRAALPKPIAPSPALIPSKPECWRFEGPADHPEITFRHELLDIHIELPLAYVNQEARSIALPWAEEHGLEPRGRRGQYPVFVRDFEPRVDALYLGPSQLKECFDEIHNPVMDPEFEGRLFSIGASVHVLSMSETALRDRMALLMVSYLTDMYMVNVEQLLVIVQPAEDHYEDAIRDRQCGFLLAPGDVWCWDCDNKRFVVDCGNGECFGDGVVSRVLQASRPDADAFPPGFKIRPVFAVRG